MMKFLLWLVVNLFSTFSIIYLYYKVSNGTKKPHFKIIIMFIFGVVIQTIIQYYEFTNIRIASYFLYFPIIFYMINPVPLKKLIFYTLIVWFSGMAIDIFSILLASIVLFVLKIIFNLHFYYSEYVSMFLTILATVFLMAVGHIKYFCILISKLYSKINKIRYSNLLLIVFSVFILGFTILMFINLNSLNINILLMIIIILMVLTFCILLKFKMNDDENIKYLKTLKENNDFYIKVDDDNRIFKHNLIAKLLSIKSVSNKKSMALIEDLIMQFNKSTDFSKSIKIIPYGLNGIIYQKIYPYLNEIKIKISNEIKYDIFAYLKPRRYNVFVEKIVVALDNAIESSLTSKDKSIVINILEENNSICVEIKNTFNADINVDSIGNKEYSTKGKKRGLGLFSIFRDNEATVSVRIINNIFESKIVAKKRLVD